MTNMSPTYCKAHYLFNRVSQITVVYFTPNHLVYVLHVCGAFYSMQPRLDFACALCIILSITHRLCILHLNVLHDTVCYSQTVHFAHECFALYCVLLTDCAFCI